MSLEAFIFAFVVALFYFLSPGVRMDREDTSPKNN